MAKQHIPGFYDPLSHMDNPGPFGPGISEEDYRAGKRHEPKPVPMDCGACRFYTAASDAHGCVVGKCRINPPTHHGWPTVHNFDWCSQFTDARTGQRPRAIPLHVRKVA